MPKALGPTRARLRRRSVDAREFMATTFCYARDNDRIDQGHRPGRGYAADLLRPSGFRAARRPPALGG